jgi:hypothetical protein
LAVAGFLLLVASDFAGFSNDLALDFRFGAFCTPLVAFFPASFARCAAFFSARFAFFPAISVAFVFFAISASVESVENDAHNKQAGA